MGIYRTFYRRGKLNKEKELQNLSSHGSERNVESNSSFVDIHIRGICHLSL